ncbi:hypothetical protein EVA_15529 [gut metagenome]|uniref:Uncharacterized protein n=1 Tax=gut metagenome TaxID=749906 RepID=J9GA99_9ZZZZ
MSIAQIEIYRESFEKMNPSISIVLECKFKPFIVALFDVLARVFQDLLLLDIKRFIANFD